MDIKAILPLFTVVILTGCSGPESDGEHAAALACKAQKILKNNIQLAMNGQEDEVDEEELQELKEELEAFKAEMDDKYSDKEDQKAARTAMKEAMKECDA